MTGSDYKQLNDLYSDRIINESDEQNEMRKNIEDLKKLYDNPDEGFAKKNYGSVDAYKKMLKKKIEDIVSKLDGPYPVYLEDDQRPKDEVDSKEIIASVGETEDQLQEPVESGDLEEKEKKKTKKIKKESINISNKGTIMSSDKTIFDKLYESVMGEADDFELGLPGEDDGLDLGDDVGGEEEGGGDVTITLTGDQVDALKAIMSQLDGDDEEEAAGEEEGEEEAEEAFDGLEEETTHTKDGSKPGVDPSDGGGKTTEPAADSLGGKSSGDGSQPVTDEEGSKDTGEGKKPGHHPKAGKEAKA